MFSVNDSIMWQSAAGVLFGVIRDISLNRNAAGEIVPWMIVERSGRVAGNPNIMICASASNLSILRVERVREYAAA